MASTAALREGRAELPPLACLLPSEFEAVLSDLGGAVRADAVLRARRASPLGAAGAFEAVGLGRLTVSLTASMGT
jgi:hypothetical protein